MREKQSNGDYYIQLIFHQANLMAVPHLLSKLYKKPQSRKNICIKKESKVREENEEREREREKVNRTG